MYKYFCYLNLITALIFCTLSSIAQQNKAEEIAIRQAIGNYYKGYLHNDSAAIAQAFDIPNAHLKARQRDSLSRQDVVKVYPLAQVAARWVSKKPFTETQKQNSHLKVLNLDILQNELAVAKIELKAGDRVYIDYLSLYKINQEWKIVNKVFVEIKP